LNLTRSERRAAEIYFQIAAARQKETAVIKSTLTAKREESTLNGTLFVLILGSTLESLPTPQLGLFTSLFIFCNTTEKWDVTSSSDTVGEFSLSHVSSLNSIG